MVGCKRSVARSPCSERSFPATRIAAPARQRADRVKVPFAASAHGRFWHDSAETINLKLGLLIGVKRKHSDGSVMCYRYLGDRTLGPLCSVPLGDEVLIALFLRFGRSLRRRRGMLINFGQTKSANFCVSRNSSVAVLADCRPAQHSCFETHERNVPLSSLTQSKPLQE